MPARCRRPWATPSLATSSTSAPSRRPTRHAHPARVRVLVGVAHGLGQDRLRERLEARRHVTLVARLERHAQVGVHARQALDLGHERRLGRARGAAERALNRRAQIGQRLLHLGRAAQAGLGGQVALAVERHRDPEQPLDHALVDLAGQVDPLLELARPLALGGHHARHRGERRRLAERPQQVPLGIVQRRLRQQRGRRRSPPGRVRPPPSARTPDGPARETRRRTRSGNCPVMSPAISITRSSRSDWAAIGADSTVTCASANGSRLSPCAPAARTRRRAES